MPSTSLGAVGFAERQRAQQLAVFDADVADGADDRGGFILVVRVEQRHHAGDGAAQVDRFGADFQFFGEVDSGDLRLPVDSTASTCACRRYSCRARSPSAAGPGTRPSADGVRRGRSPRAALRVSMVVASSSAAPRGAAISSL
jgi:hypothetical protein